MKFCKKYIKFFFCLRKEEQKQNILKLNKLSISLSYLSILRTLEEFLLTVALDVRVFFTKK